ncbi:MAG TPA: class I SAM-dependent methyltransferase [Kiritimatiellia bacterium]|nr:class I SAM-dependent methyltransferase [Kiritimatiellia bacterium]
MSEAGWKRRVEGWLRALGLLGLIDVKKRVEMRVRYGPANRRFLARHPGYEAPPAGLMFDAYSHTDLTWYDVSGREQAAEIAELIGAYRGSASAVLEWGCGPARILRHLRGLLPEGSSVTGTDYNPSTVAWAAKALPDLPIRLNGLKPPTVFEAESFDVVFAISVFTHLSEEMHRAWAAEFERLVKRGGIAIFTTHGERYCREVLNEQEQREFSNGDLVVRGGVEEGKRWYAAFHPPSYVESVMFPGWERLEHRKDPGGRAPRQDVWVLRRR